MSTILRKKCLFGVVLNLGVFKFVKNCFVTMTANYFDRLSNWFKKFKRYTVSYKNGAFHLHNLFNSPETMIESFDKMAFCKHDRVKKILVSDSVFLKSEMYYCNLEEGLWFMVSNLHFKKNVLMENLYDKSFPIEYHFINIHIKDKAVASKSLVNGLVLREKTWSMFKAGHAITEYHFKNSNEKNITVFFTTKWLENQKNTNSFLYNRALLDFFYSSNTYMILNEKSAVYEKVHHKMMELAEDNVAGKNTEKIKKIVYEIIADFNEKIKSEVVNEFHFELSDKDRKTIQRAEQFLNDNLFGDFPGIEKTAQKVGVSPTKLKKDFNSLHNITLYRYFSAQQMQLAYELLLQKQHSIKEIATLFGYENASKFSAVFKKYFNRQPSSLID